MKEGVGPDLGLLLPDHRGFGFGCGFCNDRLKLWHLAELGSFQFGFAAAGTANERECGDQEYRKDTNHGVGVDCGLVSGGLR